MSKAFWCILFFFIPVLVVRRIISYPNEFFLSIWAYVDRVCAAVPSRCSYFGGEALTKNVGRDFLSLTVIMQLVFECSYHTNVDRLHFQSCVPGFFFFVFFLSVQYNSFSFHLFSNVCPQTKWLPGVQLTVKVSCTFISEADVGIWV